MRGRGHIMPGSVGHCKDFGIWSLTSEKPPEGPKQVSDILRSHWLWCEEWVVKSGSVADPSRQDMMGTERWQRPWKWREVDGWETFFGHRVKEMGDKDIKETRVQGVKRFNQAAVKATEKEDTYCSGEEDRKSQCRVRRRPASNPGSQEPQFCKWYLVALFLYLAEPGRMKRGLLCPPSMMDLSNPIFSSRH